MKGDHHVLALSTTTDEITNEVKPLFAFSVQVCKATDDGGDVRWDNATPSGMPTAGLDLLDPDTGEAFAASDKRKGAFVDGTFHEVDADAIAEVEEATKVKTMVATGRIDLDEAWEKYGDRVTGNYILQSPAKGGSPTAYRLTYEALREQRKGTKVVSPASAIVTKRTSRSRQKLAFIYADEEAKCLRLIQVAFAAQVREPDQQVLAPQTADVDEGMIDKARQVIGQLGSGAEVLDTDVDEAVALRRQLMDDAIAGKPLDAPKKVAEKAAESNVLAALEASLA